MSKLPADKATPLIYYCGGLECVLSDKSADRARGLGYTNVKTFVEGLLEVVCHLYDLEREDFREHLDFILNRQEEEYHVIDPQAWVKERHYNEQDYQAMQEKFFAERRKSLTWLRGIPASNWDTTYTSEYGSVMAGEMFSCWIAHYKLHIRQLVELRRTRIENITRPYPLEYAGDW